MKKYFMLLAAVLVLSTTGCEKDKDNEGDNPTDITTAIAGEYNGNIAIEETIIASGVVIALTREDDTHITISMNETIQVPVVGQLPLDVQCENATVTLNSGTYTISGETVVELDLGNGLSQYNITINGTVKNDVASLAISINMGIIPVTVQFTGNKGENEPEPSNDYAAEIAGDYIGNIINNNGDIVAADATFRFIREDDTHITITMNEMVTIAPEVTVPINIQCERTAITLNDNIIYNITGEDEQEISLGFLTNIFKINIDGYVTGNRTDLTVTLTSLESSEIPPIIGQFAGTK